MVDLILSQIFRRCAQRTSWKIRCWKTKIICLFVGKIFGGNSYRLYVQRIPCHHQDCFWRPIHEFYICCAVPCTLIQSDLRKSKLRRQGLHPQMAWASREMFPFWFLKCGQGILFHEFFEQNLFDGIKVQGTAQQMWNSWIGLQKRSRWWHGILCTYNL